MKKKVATAKDFIAQSEQLKSRRLLMGLKAIDFCKDHGLNQGNFSKMERGLANPTSALEIMNVIFECWVKDQIENTKEKLKFLQTLK